MSVERVNVIVGDALAEIGIDRAVASRLTAALARRGALVLQLSDVLALAGRSS